MDETTRIDARPSIVESKPLRKGDRVERYEIIAKIGSGGMGVVYRARDPALDRVIALKLVRSDLLADARISRARMLREAQAMAQLSHPNVLPIFDVGETGDNVFIAMEYVEGSSLSRWLGAPRRATAIVDVFIQVARGIEAVHAAGLIHRDLKPANILIDRDTARVMDFGLARLSDVSSIDENPRQGSDGARFGSLSSDITAIGMVLGTPAYMAPEQMVGDSEIDARADQYAFCVALFEALFGRRPFTATNVPDLAREKVFFNIADVDVSSGLPTRVHSIVTRGLSPNAEDRWPSMGALVEALQQARAPSRRERWVLATAAVAVLGGGAWLGTQPTADPCADLPSESGRWSTDDAQTVRQAWADSDTPYWEQAWDTVGPRLDDYAQQLHTQRAALCHANVEPSAARAELTDSWAQCLDDRRRHFDALVATLNQSTTAVVQAAAERVAQLPRAELCEDPEYLTTDVPEPAVAKDAHAVATLRSELAEARALVESGRRAKGLMLAQQVVDRAEALDYPPVHAEALSELARLHMYQSETDQSVEAALEAANKGHFIAVAAKYDAIALSTAITMVSGSQDLSRLDDAERWSRTATALLAATGRDPLEHSALLRAQGHLASGQGRIAEAIALHQQAHDIEGEIFNEDHPRFAETTLSLGTALRADRSRTDDALQTLAHAVTIAESAFGPAHPKVAAFYNGLGNAQIVADQLDDALLSYERAIGIRRAAFGPDDPESAGYLLNRAHIFIARQQFEPAAATLDEVLTLWEKVHGPEHPKVAMVLNNLGVVHQGLGDFALSTRLFRRALGIYERVHGPEHPLVATSHSSLGENASHAGDPEQARRHFEQVLAIAMRSPVHPLDRATASFGLARLDWDTAPDAARSSAKTAYKTVVDEVGEADSLAKKIDQWLVEHGGH